MVASPRSDELAWVAREPSAVIRTSLGLRLNEPSTSVGAAIYLHGMGDDVVSDEKRMLLRYAGTCRVCGATVPARADAIYERSTKTVRCLGCSVPEDVLAVAAPAHVDVGTPGASARREHERRHASREERVRSKHPKIGGLLLALSEDPQSTTAWHAGAVGEERLGAKLNELASDRLRVLHDRRIPGTRSNIDHIAVSSTGIYVVDAKQYKGRPALKIEGGVLRPRVETLFVGSRDRSKLVDGVLRQVDVVRPVVADRAPLIGVLCFIDADWPLVGGAFAIRGVRVTRPRKLYSSLAAEGSLGAAAIDELHRAIAEALPPA